MSRYATLGLNIMEKEDKNVIYATKEMVWLLIAAP